MTEPETAQSVPENEHEKPATTDEIAPQETDAEPPPEPWTPERVSEWNAYYDVYVMLAALLLVFVVSCNYVSDPQFWLNLKAGQLIAERQSPIKTDVFSYTESGRAWVDTHWLFQWANAAIYKLVIDLVPVNPDDTTANRASAEQIAVGSLLVVSALMRLATAWLLLKIRRPGPGLWWSAIVVTLCLGAVFNPMHGLVMGGLANVATPLPRTWGLMFFAFEMYALYRALFLGRPRALWFLVPTFVLWANIDPSFFTGLLLLAAAGIGALLDGKSGIATATPPENPGKDSAGDLASESRRPPAVSVFAILAVCALACLANPYTYQAYVDAVFPYLYLFQPATKVATFDLLSFFGPWVYNNAGPDWYLLPAFFITVVLIGLGSFFLNIQRFSWSRFLPFAVISFIWGTFMFANAMFAVVFATVVAPNCQEWYHDKFGSEGRLGRTWTTWSTGGRLVTLGALFFLVFLDITGWKNTLHEVQFGLGFNPDGFTFTAAEFLASNKEIEGKVLNTSMAQGDALIWKGAPRIQTYVDSRPRFFPAELLVKWEETRKALSDDDVEKWKPLLDKYGISAIMIEAGIGQSPATYQRLMQSPNWVPFYDDGRIVMFGRADAKNPDLAFFKANRLDPDLRAYRTTSPVPGNERPPNPTSMIDAIFESRTRSRLNSRTQSAQRWLNGLSQNDPASASGLPPIPEPARCLLAIREARTALAKSPDDWIAYRILNEAYRNLMMQEAGLLAGIPPTPENANRIRSTVPKLEIQMGRFQQRVTALNFAIQTTPPPDSQESRGELLGLNLELFRLYMNANALDLARDRLQYVLDASQPEDFPAEVRAQFKKQVDELDQHIKLVEDSLVELETERQAGPVEQSNFAAGRGATGRAISLLAEAERNNVSPAAVKPRLIDLYCNTGQPDRAVDLLTTAIDDPNLGAEPGSGASRQGRAYFLLGNYLSARSLWRDRAIPRVRMERSSRALEAARSLTRGETVQATDLYLMVPGTLGKQASWEFDLAMCELEAGLPVDAAEHFTNALTWAPDLPIRPIAAYYLEKLGKPVPELPAKSTTAAAKPATPAPATPATSPGPAATQEKGTVASPAARPEAPKPASPQPPSSPAEKAKAVAPQGSATTKEAAPK
jgi:tetratricopeptide (TPR) repeat protein